YANVWSRELPNGAALATGEIFFARRVPAPYLLRTLRTACRSHVGLRLFLEYPTPYSAAKSSSAAKVQPAVCRIYGSVYLMTNTVGGRPARPVCAVHRGPGMRVRVYVCVVGVLHYHY